jgi:hypothetical protein
MSASPNITICRPGERSRHIVRRSNPDRPTQTRISGFSHERFNASAEAAQTEVETLAVVLAQPHRRGVSDPRSERAGTALGRYCSGLGTPLWLAGNLWHEMTRAYQQSLDLNVPDRGPGTGEGKTEDQIAAANALAIQRRKDAEHALNSRIAIGIMDRLTIEDRDPASSERDLALKSLYKLANHFKTTPRRTIDND